MVLEVCLPSTTQLILISCYRPPSENVDTALDVIRSVISEIPTKNEIYIMGDFNLDYMCIGSPTFKKLKTFERSYQFIQYIANPTRVSANSVSLIDHIYTNSHLLSGSGTLNINVSDHYPCYIIRKKTKIPHLTTTFKCRKLKHFDHSFFKNRLLELDWRPFYEITDPDSAWELLYNMLVQVIDIYYPLQLLLMYQSWLPG